MNKQKIKNEISELLFNNGFTVFNQNSEDVETLIELDSLQFISFLVDVEEKYNIIIPDEYLAENEKITLEKISEFILNYTIENNNISF